MLYIILKNDTSVYSYGNLAADDRFQCWCQHPTAFLHVDDGDVVHDGIADEFASGIRAGFLHRGIALVQQFFADVHTDSFSGFVVHFPPFWGLEPLLNC